MRHNMRNAVPRYVVAALCVVLATWARAALAPWLGDHSPFTTFFIAVVVVATYGGFGPAIVATALGALAAILCFTPPKAELNDGGIEYLIGLILYLVGGLVLAMLCESLRAARRRSESHVEQALARQQQLESEVQQRARAESLNAELFREVQEANRRKDVFLAMLAHELRNPLAPIRSAVEVMRLLSPKDERLNWSRDVIARQVEHLARLVDDLLDVSRLMRGMIRLKMSEVELASVIAQAVEASRPQIEAAGHEFCVSLPRELILLRADPTRLTQVFVNLLNNAAKYTERGGHITLRAERQDGEIAVRVRDDGRGMPAALLPRVFDLFTQGDRTLARSEGGLGVGLTLVKSLVELHGGRVEACSEGPGRGSEFVVRLPILSATTPAGNSSRDGKGGAAMARVYHILVVDDKPDAADSLALLLRVSGHDVRTAYSGPAALEAARAFSPDIVFLDLGMPGMDGYEVARRLRGQPGHAETLLVALTGYNQEDDVRRSHDAGFDTHLCKPADMELVGDLLHSWEARRRTAECAIR